MTVLRLPFRVYEPVEPQSGNVRVVAAFLSKEDQARYVLSNQHRVLTIRSNQGDGGRQRERSAKAIEAGR